MADETEKSTPIATKADATPAGAAGKPPGAERAKEEAKTATPKAAAKPKRAPRSRKAKQVQTGSDTPEAKATPKGKSDAAKKMFANADDAARMGLPPELTQEQHDNMQRRHVLGY